MLRSRHVPTRSACRSGSVSAATPASAVRAGGFGLPMTLALIGGSPAAAAPVVGLYRQARETFFPYYRHYIAEQLDGARDDREGQAAKIDLGKDALVAEEPVLPQSLVDD